jgi:copper chaperone NosL
MMKATMLLPESHHHPNALVRAVLALSVLVTIACGPPTSGPPEILVDRTACDHCMMLISDPLFAAAFRGGGREAVFDDIGCMLVEVAAGAETQASTIWVHDYQSGRWLDAADAVFVRSAQISTPMASGIVATRERATAVELATRTDGEVIDSLADLLRRVTEAEAVEPGSKGGTHGH